MEITNRDIATLEMMYDNFIHENHIINVDFKFRCRLLINKMYRLKLDQEDTKFNTQFKIYKYITGDNK